jgi:hypothetical protein
MNRRIFTATMLALMIGLLVMVPAVFAKESGNNAWSPFSKAHWVKGVGNPGYGLVTTSVSTSSTTTYGGIQLKKSFTPKNPSSITALSFDFKPNQTGNSGGSPRMVVQFSDGGDGELRPVAWVANTWTHLDGMTGANWDNNGGSCGFVYATTWTAVMTCHAGATITSIFVVNDSGWLYPSTGEQVILDNITVNKLTATGPGE